MTAGPILADGDLLAITEQIWASYLDLDGASPFVPLSSAEPALDVHASVSVTGAWRGHILVTCSMGAARNVAGALLGIDLDDVTPEDVSDAVGELANIIGGNVKSLMPEPSALSLPVVLVDGNVGFPSAIEVGSLVGEWLGEPIAVQVLESTAEKDK
ncbi:chemotaxis protein CheX [Planosporangium thailandense]|uniref:Chemotaxis protein CheX n=1 Tax=Planosporangium thailandense TaxID=765197 RepID=A0ABX0Y091_9ACTN|nr:chemotaxis protein CheX [Planosporangium thailandense]NJC71766.1 chemotaxis protein CheX [Planosporangium thailandense]